MRNLDAQCLLLRRLPIFTELQDMVKTYLVYDRTHFVQHHATKMRATLNEILAALSRRNGFGGVEPNDTLNEHWIFATEDYRLALQSVSCCFCGNFLLTSHMELLGEMSRHSLCYCDRYLFYTNEDFTPLTIL